MQFPWLWDGGTIFTNWDGIWGMSDYECQGEEQMDPTVVSSWNDFAPLRHVIVGRADFTCIPPLEPATEAKVPEDSDMRGMWGPRPQHTVEQANERLDTLVGLRLEKKYPRQTFPFGFAIVNLHPGIPCDHRRHIKNGSAGLRR